MRKHEELNDPTSCLSKALDEEGLFVLLGRDAAAPAAIRFWVAERLRLGKNVERDPQIQEALDRANQMERERADLLKTIETTKHEARWTAHDWHCTQCAWTNMAIRQRCRNCGRDRDDAPESDVRVPYFSASEHAEYRILAMMTEDTHKFAIQVGYPLDEAQQAALERLLLRDWVRLIDVTPVAIAPDRTVRVFRVMPEAVAWYRGHRACTNEAVQTPQ